MRSSAAKIQMTSFDDLFQSSGTEQQTAAEQIQDIALEKLISFHNHPFQVRDDEEMRKTVESVAQYGVLVPAIARPVDGGQYELVSGHRRKRASELAGKDTMPVIIRTLDDDEATIIMVDANLQREKLLPSEKAFAYKMKLEAMKHQGKRSDLTSERVVLKLNTRDRIAQDAGEKSGMAVARYISLTKLISPLLQMVDEGKFSVSMAADYISSLAQAEQERLSAWMSQTGRVPTQFQLKQLKQNSQKGTLDDETMDAILTERSEEPLRMTIRKDKLQRFFPAAYTMAQMEEVIFSLLESWHTQNV
ncbi:ParB/RepB/Spo0J family partition protein [Oscillospiraceae bacterium 50-16]|mgnify:FL=1|jgi:ParB family chromosome partitioning protein|nr:ParB/RepB/Spo0J family partition protein [Acutalibacter muris]